MNMFYNAHGFNINTMQEFRKFDRENIIKF